MKRKLLMALFLSLVIDVLAACGGSMNESASTEEGDPNELFKNPQSERLQTFLGEFLV